jgi:hypothetical protein
MLPPTKGTDFQVVEDGRRGRRYTYIEEGLNKGLGSYSRTASRLFIRSKTPRTALEGLYERLLPTISSKTAMFSRTMLSLSSLSSVMSPVLMNQSFVSGSANDKITTGMMGSSQ